MTLVKLCTFAGALVTASAIAACNRHHRTTAEPAIISPRLGESTASPGSDPDRPVARSTDTHEVSAPIRRLPTGSAPIPPLPGQSPAPPPPDAGSPGVFSPPPDAAP